MESVKVVLGQETGEEAIGLLIVSGGCGKKKELLLSVMQKETSNFRIRNLGPFKVPIHRSLEYP